MCMMLYSLYSTHTIFNVVTQLTVISKQESFLNSDLCGMGNRKEVSFPAAVKWISLKLLEHTISE